MARHDSAAERDEAMAEIAAYIRTGMQDEITLAKVMHLAQLMARSLDDLFRNFDTTLYAEFREIARVIDTMKVEMGALQANEMVQKHIPSAGRELDEVVRATESATHTIMENAETIMAADPAEPDTYHATVNDCVMQIFEACSFQDITGQRISKVVETLQYIDRRVSRLANQLHLEDGQVGLSAEEAARQARREKELCHGPQLSGEGVAQSDVDALFGQDSTETAGQDERQNKDGNSQADIDNLFP